MFQRVGGTNFRFVWKFWGGARSSAGAKIEAPRARGGGVRGGGLPLPAGVEVWGGAVPPPRKIFVTYSRKGAFWWIPDAFCRTTFEVVICCAVHTMLQGYATDSVSSSQTNCSSWGPLAPDKHCPRLSPFCSLHPLRSLSLTLLLLPRQLKLTRCSYAAASSHQTFHAYDTFENRSFERLLTPVIVYLQCMLRDSHCYFSAMRLKSGATVPPTPKSGGTCTSRPPESYVYVV